MRVARAKRVERLPPAEEGDVQETLTKDSYTQVLELEHQLLTTIQFKGPFDPNVAILRRNIRELYESIILEDHEFAESHDIEQSLWRLHHTCIEEYRARIRKSMPPVGAAASGNKSVARREPVQKIKAVFRTYLAEATGFYHDLFLKIGAKHGISQDDLTYSSVIDKSPKKDDKRIAELRRCQRSCHRCLIYLGDLARYKESCGDGDTKNHDWSIAAGFYVRAASMWPSSGNPYNQLAVLATYIGDEMLAVYHYFRSLASEIPFLTAKDNLVLLFEKNRHSYLRLAALSAGNSSEAKLGKSKVKGDAHISQITGAENSTQILRNSESTESKTVRMDLLKNFRVRFVRLNGILFTRTSLEAFSEVQSSVLTDLEELLTSKERAEEAPSGPYSLTSGRLWGTGPNILLQLISILIFSVHSISVGSGPESHQPTYAEILQRSVVLTHAMIALFECVGYILQHCARLDDPSNSLFLPAIMVVMEWLSSKPEITVGNEVKEKEATARIFFWRNCVNFLNKFTTGDMGCIAADDAHDRISLREDFELWGFTPLLTIQHKLDNGKKPDVGLGSQRERHARVNRVKHAGKVIAGMFGGSEKGIHYDVGTDAFYLMNEKKSEDRKRVDAPASVDGHNLPLLRSVKDGSNTRQVSEPESVSTKGCFPVEEEDEEVIVFKPSSKSKDYTTVPTTCAPLAQEICISGSESASQDVLKTGPVLLSSTIQPEMPLQPRNSQAIESGVPSMAVAAVIAPAVSTLPVLSSSIPKLSEPGDWASRVPGSTNDFTNVLGSAGYDLNLEKGSLFQGPLLDSGGLLEKDLRAPGSHFEIGQSLGSTVGLVGEDSHASSSPFEPGQTSGSTVDWGVAGFSLQPSRNPIPTSVNWQLHDGQGQNSLWSTELHKFPSLKAPYGAQTAFKLPTVRRFSFMDPSLGPVQSTAVTTASKGLSELSNLPTQSMEPHSIDACPHMKPNFQDQLNLIPENKIGTFSVAEELNLLGAKLKLNSGILIDNEKPARRLTNLPNMRPPPGFGPLPAKPPLPLSATLTFQTSQPALSEFLPASASLQQNTVLDQSGALSGEEHDDDYTWLDGYTPPKKETNQSSLLGSGLATNNTNYGWLSSGFHPAIEATASPFPGMKTLDRYSSPPPISGPWQHPPKSHALLPQELLHIQQTQEQYQQQLLQQQRLQQFYDAQIAAQQHHIQQGEQQPSTPSLPQQPLALQQQMPPLLWPGQNSFVT